MTKHSHERNNFLKLLFHRKQKKIVFFQILETNVVQAKLSFQPIPRVYTAEEIFSLPQENQHSLEDTKNHSI